MSGLTRIVDGVCILKCECVARAQQGKRKSVVVVR